jgi:hypothetical protein
MYNKYVSDFHFTKDNCYLTFLENLFKQKLTHYCLRSINSFILFGIRKNCLISGRSLLLHQFTKRMLKLTVIIIMRYQWYQLRTECYRYPLLKVKSVHRWSFLGIIGVAFYVTDQLQITFSAFVRYLRKTGVQWDIHHLFTDFKKAYDSVGRKYFSIFS